MTNIELEPLIPKPRLKQLDALRFFAISVIILSHFEFLKDSRIGVLYTEHLHNPTWGVDYFFMLSGFGLFYSTYHRQMSYTFKDSINFAINKIRKIYPIYVFSLLIGVIYSLCFTGQPIRNLSIKFLCSLSLIQSAFGMMRFSHMINGVCWFLSTLFIIYIFAPKLLCMVNKLSSLRAIVYALITSIVLILVFSIAALFIEKNVTFHENQIFDDLFYGSPYIRFLYVFIGMLCARLMQELKEAVANKELSAVEIISVMLAICYFFMRNCIPLHVVILRFFDILTASSMLLIFSIKQGKISRWLDNCKTIQKYGGGMECTCTCSIIR